MPLTGQHTREAGHQKGGRSSQLQALASAQGRPVEEHHQNPEQTKPEEGVGFSEQSPETAQQRGEGESAQARFLAAAFALEAYEQPKPYCQCQPKQGRQVDEAWRGSEDIHGVPACTLLAGVDLADPHPALGLYRAFHRLTHRLHAQSVLEIGRPRSVRPMLQQVAHLIHEAAPVADSLA